MKWQPYGCSSLYKHISVCHKHTEHICSEGSSVFNHLHVVSLSSSSSNSGHSGVEKDDGSSQSEPGAPENERHVYKSVLEGGDIPLQGLRALNKRHGSASSSKGRIPTTL